MAASDRSSIVAFLAQNSLFQGLPPEYLARLAGYCLLRTFRKKSVLFSEGESGRSAYLLIRGQIRLSRQTEDGRDVVIKSVRPGELFAEVILFESDDYPVTAEALTEVRCIAIDRSEFHRLLSDELFRNRFIGLLMERQRYLTGRVQYLTSFDLEERFFRYLHEHIGNRTVFEPGISRKDIAAAIGATPESLSRLIRRLTAEGRIQWKGRVIHLGEPLS